MLSFSVQRRDIILVGMLAYNLYVKIVPYFYVAVFMYVLTHLAYYDRSYACLLSKAAFIMCGIKIESAMSKCITCSLYSRNVVDLRVLRVYLGVEYGNRFALPFSADFVTN